MTSEILEQTNPSTWTEKTNPKFANWWQQRTCVLITRLVAMMNTKHLKSCTFAGGASPCSVIAKQRSRLCTARVWIIRETFLVAKPDASSVLYWPLRGLDRWCVSRTSYGDRAGGWLWTRNAWLPKNGQIKRGQGQGLKGHGTLTVLLTRFCPWSMNKLYIVSSFTRSWVMTWWPTDNMLICLEDMNLNIFCEMHKEDM